MTVSSRTSLLLWILLPAFTLSADVPNCPNRSKDYEDLEMRNYSGPHIDAESCTQRPVVVFPDGIWNLIRTRRNPLQFVFTPHYDFEYFEVLFSRGQRSDIYNLMRVNKSRVDAGPYVVSITFRTEPIASIMSRIVGDIFIYPSDGPLRTNRQSGENPRQPSGNDDSFLAGVKEISCSSELAPENLVLSTIVILVVGGSEWLFLPDPEWSKCPTTQPNRDFAIHENTRRNPDNDFNNRSPPRYPVVSTTTWFPTHRLRTTKPPVEETGIESTTIAWDHRIQPRLPEHDHYGRNQSSSPPPDVTGFRDDLIYGDEKENPTSNATEGRVLKESGIAEDIVIASSIVGVLAIVLLAIGCCFLFRHLNLQGSYGVHSNTYEPQSSLHLRDSQYDHDTGRANPGHSATDATASHATKPAASLQMTSSHDTTPAASQSTTPKPGSSSGGIVNQTIDEESEGTPC